MGYDRGAATKAGKKSKAMGPPGTSNYDSESPAFPFALEVWTDSGWKRMMIRYSTREIAEGWLPFVMDYWKTNKGRIVDIRTIEREART